MITEIEKGLEPGPAPLLLAAGAEVVKETERTATPEQIEIVVDGVGTQAVQTEVMVHDPDTVGGLGESVAYPDSEYGDAAIDGGT